MGGTRAGGSIDGPRWPAAVRIPDLEPGASDDDPAPPHRHLPSRAALRRRRRRLALLAGVLVSGPSAAAAAPSWEPTARDLGREPDANPRLATSLQDDAAARKPVLSAAPAGHVEDPPAGLVTVVIETTDAAATEAAVAEVGGTVAEALPTVVKADVPPRRSRRWRAARARPSSGSPTTPGSRRSPKGSCRRAPVRGRRPGGAGTAPRSPSSTAASSATPASRAPRHGHARLEARQPGDPVRRPAHRAGDAVRRPRHRERQDVCAVCQDRPRRHRPGRDRQERRGGGAHRRGRRSVSGSSCRWWRGRIRPSEPTTWPSFAGWKVESEGSSWHGWGPGATAYCPPTTWWRGSASSPTIGPPTSRFVVFGEADGRVVSLVIRPEGSRLIDLGPSEALAQDIESFRDSIKDRADPREAVARLRARLVAPVALAPGVTRVVISPDANLSLVPWSLLWLDKETACVPSAAVWACSRAAAAPRDAAYSRLAPRTTRKNADWLRCPRRKTRSTPLAI